ncbi:MAG TPA: glycoside hydrolase family 15 protein [Fimbriimonadaceae bacterium]|nr:glycoside hydrolase family 15 protein [Fimbriimonadaceae bacterium]
MPRPLVYGNGKLLIGLDGRHTIRELFWPHVGHYNHLSGHPIRMGVWVDGQFSWCDSEEWEITQSFGPDSPVGGAMFICERLSVMITCSEAVDPREPIFVRRLFIMGPPNSEIRIFFSHDLRIAKTDIGDTAFFNPFLEGVVHYKWDNYFLFGGTGLAQYTTGIKAFEGMEGTWRDAEDGQLSSNPIAQGSVDSTIALHVKTDREGAGSAEYWIICGASLEDLEHRSADFRTHSQGEGSSQTQRLFSTRLNTIMPELERAAPAALPWDLRDLAKRSYHILLTHIDHDGAIIAANDSDIMKTNRANYSYMWPRDGAFVSALLSRIGDFERPLKFFQFCSRLIAPERPFFLQKYKPEGSLGASWHPWIVDGKPEIPLQEDETALVVWAGWEHFSRHPDEAALAELYDSLFRPTADFLISFRDPQTNLPLASYDLWEERRGVHAFTCASVVAGLRAAAELGKAAGDPHYGRFTTAAEETREALMRHFYSPDLGRFRRSLGDDTVDSSTLQVALLGVVPPDSDEAQSTARSVEEALTVRLPAGGLARYTGDYYFRVNEDYPGNPWIITTLWLAQHEIACARSREDLESPLSRLRWVRSHANTTGVLPEQLHPVSGDHLAVSPLTWSHSELLLTCQLYAEKLQELG